MKQKMFLVVIFAIFFLPLFLQAQGLMDKTPLFAEATQPNEAELWAREAQIQKRKSMLIGLNYECLVIRTEQCVAILARSKDQSHAMIDFISLANTRGVTVSYMLMKNSETIYLETKEIYGFSGVYEVLLPDTEPNLIGRQFQLVAEATKLSPLDIDTILKVHLIFE